jgi:4-carboxymuconolactone decarboxylase
MAFSRRKFIQTGVGSAVAVAASVAGAEALHTAMSNSEPATTAVLPESQAINLPPSPQASSVPPAGQGAKANTYQSPVTWAGAPNVTMAPDRMPEIPADKMTDAQKKASEEFAEGRGTAVFGPFVPLLRSPEVMLRTKAMGDYLRFRSVLPPKVSEYAILITARHWSNEYEWAVHFPIAEKAGVNPDLLGMLAEGRQVKGVYETDQLTYEFCTELLKNKCVSDTTYHWAVLKIGEQGVIDLTALVGYYSMLALVLNMARTPLPAGAKPALPLFPR